MVVRSMLTSWRDSVRRGRWRPSVWTQRNGASTCSHTQVSNTNLTSKTRNAWGRAWLMSVFLTYFLTLQTLLLYSSLFPSPLLMSCNFFLVPLSDLTYFCWCFSVKVRQPTLPSTRPLWSPMAGSWDWTFLMEVTWHTASWLRKRKSQRRPSSLSPCRTRYTSVSCKLSMHTQAVGNLALNYSNGIWTFLLYLMLLYNSVIVCFIKSFLS